ncbi:MAG: RadC family protein [Acholeplasmatales bacterium]
MNYKMKEIPEYERPRERLKKYGAVALSNVELLAILLQTGTKDESVLELSRRILYTLERPSMLLNMSLEELKTIKGIGPSKASTVIAALELYKRLIEDLNKKKTVIKDASDVYYLFEDMSLLEQEHFYCLYLDTKLKIIAKKQLFIGGVNANIITPRDIYKYSIRLNSPSVLFIHNHPSGDPTPSKSDLITTEKLVEGAKTIGVNVIDHIIIGKKSCYSIMLRKQINF